MKSAGGFFAFNCMKMCISNRLFAFHAEFCKLLENREFYVVYLAYKYSFGCLYMYIKRRILHEND